MGLEFVNHDRWNHIDFLFAIDVKEYFYNSLLGFLNYVVSNSGSVEMLVERELVKRRRIPLSRNGPLRRADFIPPVALARRNVANTISKRIGNQYRY